MLGATTEAFKASGNWKDPKVLPGFEAQPGRAPDSAGYPALLSARESASVDGVIYRLQQKILQFKIPVADFLVDYDRHKLGAISRSQFRRGLSFAFGDAYIRESVTEEELNALEETFKKEMTDGEQYFDWRAFAKKLNEALLVSNLETQPSTTPAARLIERQPVTLSPEEEARVAVVLGQMRERFRIRSVYAKAPFHDFAQNFNSPMLVDHITRQQFVQGLSRLGIELDGPDCQLLFKKYDDDGEGTVNYVAFSRDVDPTETFSDRKAITPAMLGSFYGGFREPKVHEAMLKSL